jgi:hypothetical protein
MLLRLLWLIAIVLLVRAVFRLVRDEIQRRRLRTMPRHDSIDGKHQDIDESDVIDAEFTEVGDDRDLPHGDDPRERG